MHVSPFHYLPLSLGFFSILVGLFLILFVFLVVGALRQAYLSLGVSSSTAMWLLFASLVGSYFNIPVANLPDERVMSNQVIDFFGIQYAVPVVAEWPGTVIAVNVGGAIIPTLMSLYLLITRRLWLNGAIATALVALVLHWLAIRCPASASRCRCFCRPWSRPSSLWCCRAETPRRSPISPAAWAR
jgi:uncharacterized membrane protein